MRTFADWKDPVPGYVEADLVSHSGPNASGSFAQTLTLTDVASGWTECVALVVRDGALVTEALTRLRKAMPFRLLGFDTDNGSEFLNEVVIAYCRDNAIELPGLTCAVTQRGARSQASIFPRVTLSSLASTRAARASARER